VLKLKEEIEHRVQQQVRRRGHSPFLALPHRDTALQVLALRHVIADVEGAASHAVVPCVKLHNKQR
jgi:type III secretory pathway component EscV